MSELEPRIIDLEQHVDDRGLLFEAWRESWDCIPPLKQVYMVRNRTPFTVRAFHAHKELWDGFCIVNGSAKFHLFTLYEEVVSFEHMYLDNDFSIAYPERCLGDTWTYTLDSRKPQLLIIPPTIFHGWVSLEPNTLLLSLASHEYSAENPDEVRVSPSFGQDWNWGLEAK